MRRVVAVAVLLFTLVGATAACSPLRSSGAGSGQPVEEPVVEEAPPVPKGPHLPAGFQDAGTGLAIKWIEKGDARWDCSYYDSCVVLELYAYENCPRMVFVSANIKDGNTVISSTNGSLASLRVGEHGIVTLGQIGTGAGYRYELTDVSCM